MLVRDRAGRGILAGASDLVSPVLGSKGEVQQDESSFDHDDLGNPPVSGRLGLRGWLPRAGLALVAAVGCALMAAPAQARPGMHNLRLELNGAAVVGEQSDRFDFGGGGGVGYGLRFVDFLEIEASYRMALLRATSEIDGQDGYGGFHALGLGLRLHPLPMIDAGDLYVAVGGDVVFTGEVIRPGLSARIGFEFEAHWAFRVGPFVGFHHVFQLDDEIRGPGDGSFITFGISMGFLGDEPASSTEDGDGDGIVDSADQCPGEPEDIDGFQDQDGCPDPDNDGDGVPDQSDRCPEQAATTDADGDGCSDQDPDPDGDGVDVSRDRCPDAPEDRDGFRDEDGCPDDDNDGDGIQDTADECPDRPEDHNGVEDEDGCPEGEPQAEPQAAPQPQETASERETREEVEDLAQRILFPRNSDQPTRRSRRAIDEVAQILREHPEITHVRISGHASPTGDPDYNMELSRRRANRVKELLVNRGVEASRLTVQAVGITNEGENERAHAQARRVTFTIVRE